MVINEFKVNNPVKENCLKIIPARLPPANIPRNWLLEYIPMAVPRPFFGACLPISDGRFASKKLKAIKYRIMVVVI